MLSDISSKRISDQVVSGSHTKVLPARAKRARSRTWPTYSNFESFLPEMGSNALMQLQYAMSPCSSHLCSFHDAFDYIAKVLTGLVVRQGIGQVVGRV